MPVRIRPPQSLRAPSSRFDTPDSVRCMSEHVFVPGRPPPFTEAQLRSAVAEGSCWSDVLRALGLGTTGHNGRTVRRYAQEWKIATDHFDPSIGRRRANAVRRRPLEQVLVAGSRYDRGSLKRRLFAEGLKERRCELCGQGEEWRGRRMALILDHVNGVPDDHRLENLRIVCPNCAATLDTHCGRNRAMARPRRCVACDAEFQPRHPRHRYCSITCVGRANAEAFRGREHPERRRVERPPYEVLVREVEELGWSAVGRRYGVSDNAVRKWVRWYEDRPDR